MTSPTRLPFQQASSVLRLSAAMQRAQQKAQQAIAAAAEKGAGV